MQNRRILRPLLACLLWVLFAQAAPAAPPQNLAEPRFEAVGDPASLNDNVVSALVRDAQGFLWIGTSTGLVRFDGHRFLPIAGQSEARGTRGTAFVRTLLATRDGRLWAGTESEGLAVYEPQRERWTFFRHDPAQAGGMARGAVRALAEDGDGRVWIGSIGGGLQWLSAGGTRFQTLGLADGLPDLRVQALVTDAQGGLWIGTWNGLAHLPRGARRAQVPPWAEPLAGQGVLTLRWMTDDSLWIGSQQGGLWRLARGAQQLQRLDEGTLPLGAVQALSEVGREVWVGRAAGIELRGTGGDLRRALRPQLSKPWGLPGADIRAFVVDPSGPLWVGGYGSGLLRVNGLDSAVWVRRPDDDPRAPMAQPDVRSLWRARDGRVVVGLAEGGLAWLDAELRSLTALRPGERGLASGRVAALGQGSDGTLWAGIETQVQALPSGNAAARSYSVGQGRVRRLWVDGQDVVWAGTQDGLYRLAPQESQFERVPLADGSALLGDINALASARDGSLWVGGENGLYSVAPGTRQLHPVRAADEAALHNTNIVGLLWARDGTLWVDTSAGLHRMRPMVGAPPRFEALGGVAGPAGAAFGANLLEDERGRIWTHRGVFDPATRRYQALSQADGVDFGTGWFRAYNALADGRLLFGGSRGLLVVQPQAFQSTAYAPKLVVTELRLGGRAVPPAAYASGLEVPHAAGSFSLEFAAMELSEPGRQRFRYRLVGHDNGWVETGAQARHVAYGGLDPGTYTLRVQGSNRHGDWSPHELQLPVQVLPAWWQTWWGRLLQGLGVLLLALAGARWRQQQFAAREAELEARVAERTQALAAATVALREKSEALEESALSDPLTGLRNRRFVMQRLDDDLRLLRRQLDEAQRRGEPPPQESDLGFVLLDIDHFKRINDSHGHAAGDAVLMQMRERLMEVFRESDYLVRWGGEEFLVVARGSHRSGLPELAERARRRVSEQPFVLPGGATLRVSCSLGFAAFPLEPTAPRAGHWHEALQLADAALYAAKREGRDRWVGLLSLQGQSVGAWLQGLGAGQTPPGTLLRGPAAHQDPAPAP